MSERRGSEDDKKGGSGNSTQTSGGWVPLKPLPSPPKRQWSETGNQSEIPKQFCSTPPFQDGGNSSTERHHETRGLDDENRPKRCIFLSTNISRGQEISLLQMEKQDISVQLPTFWSVMHSLGLYQDNQGSSGDPKEHGHSSYHILYIEDILIIAETESQVRDQTAALLYLLENLGFVINYPKSQLKPTQMI